jgi:predicted PurR-regulated permease PerM
LLIGILASYALRPVVDRLRAYRIPRAAAAALVLAVLVGGLSWIISSLSDDAAAMIEKLPEAARELRQTVGAARTGAPTALQNIQKAANELEGAAAEAAGGKTPAARAAAPRDAEPTWLRDYMLAQSALLITVVAPTPIVLLITYFLLASGKSRPSVIASSRSNRQANCLGTNPRS